MQSSPLLRHRWMRHLMLTMVVCIQGGVEAQPHARISTRTEEPRRFVVEKALVSGGALELAVNSGDVRIVRNPAPGQIRLEVEVIDRRIEPAQAQLRWLKRMDVLGRQASIDVEVPTGRWAGQTTIYVPAMTSLVVKMHDGRLIVAGITGDKDLRVRSGMLTLREADPAAYRHVRAQVHMGELTDGIFHGKQRGLLGRSLILEGPGQYQLLLEVRDGDLVLTGEDGGQ